MTSKVYLYICFLFRCESLDVSKFILLYNTTLFYSFVLSHLLIHLLASPIHAELMLKDLSMLRNTVQLRDYEEDLREGTLWLAVTIMSDLPLVKSQFW